MAPRDTKASADRPPRMTEIAIAAVLRDFFIVLALQFEFNWSIESRVKASNDERIIYLWRQKSSHFVLFRC